MGLDIENKYGGDSVLVVGSQDAELKFAFTTKFTNTKYVGDNSSQQSNSLQPRFLIGTSGCIGAGLDCPDVHLIVRLGLPTSIINLIQEMGRCGRSNIVSNCNESIDDYHIIFTIHDYVYLYERLFITTENQNESDNLSDNASTYLISKEQFRQFEIQNLNLVCAMLFLNYGCWHNYIEISSGNPSRDQRNHSYSPCGTMCPYCTNEITNISKPVSKDGVCSFLVAKMFNTPKQCTAIELGDALHTHPGSGKSIFGRRTALQPEKKSDCYVVIIQLILTGILELKVDPSPNPKSFCILTFNNENEPKYLKEQYWYYIRHY